MGVNPTVTVDVSEIRDGKALVAVSYRGQPAVPAQHVGELLGYAGRGRTLAKVIRKDWADEFQPGIHLDVLRGDALAEFKRAAQLIGADVSASTRALTVLYPKGIELLTRKTGRKTTQPNSPASGTSSPDAGFHPPAAPPWWWGDVHRYLDRCVASRMLTENEALKRMVPFYQDVFGISV